MRIRTRTTSRHFRSLNNGRKETQKNTNYMNRVFFVFDVESIGLHGEGFAVAGGVYFEDGTVDKASEFLLACAPQWAEGNDDDRAWVAANVPTLPETHLNPLLMRDEFWRKWRGAKEKYPKIVMAVECGWPVEARFLSDCIADSPFVRRWEGPYPLHEIATYLAAAGMDPMANYDRMECELPKHHPLADARQSSRLLCEALEIIAEQAISS
jgi:hypothetical protein